MSPLFDDTDHDVALPRRGEGAGVTSSGRSAHELDDVPADREVTLNTGIVLALFFALALLCAVFFGFGYSIGHKSAPAATMVASDNAAPVVATPAGSTSSIKPAPGTAAVPEYVPSTAAAISPSRPASVTTEPAAGAVQRTVPATGTNPPDTISKPAPVVRAPAPLTETQTVPTASPTGTVYVQVAAVSHQEDADVLLSALRRRGYTVLTRTDAADHLIHVQIGPYATRKDADVMRQKLLGDGYNAILK